MHVPLHVAGVLLCLVFRRLDQFSECFSVFSHPPPPLSIIITLLLLSLLLLLLLVSTVIVISTELLALCDRCLGWGWVWQAGLVTGLRVGQAFGVLLLPGLGVSSPGPGHPTSICGTCVNHGKLIFMYHTILKAYMYLTVTAMSCTVFKSVIVVLS